MAAKTADTYKINGREFLIGENFEALLVNYDGAAPAATDTITFSLEGRQLLFDSDPAVNIVGLSEDFTAAVSGANLVLTVANDMTGTDFSFLVLLKRGR